MGLQEKQAWAAIHEAAKEVEAKLKAQGTPITFSYNEASFPNKDVIGNLSAALEQAYDGIRNLASDAMAKEAVQVVKKIEFTHAAQDAFAMKLAGGTLKVTGNYDGSGMSGIQYVHGNDIQKFLTENL